MESGLGQVGEFIGSILRFVIDALRAVTFGIGDLVDSFFSGLARGIGLANSSAFSIAVAVLGLLLLWLALRAFLRRRIIGGIIWTVLGLIVIGWVVR